MSLLLLISALVFLINVPFGAWRAHVPARSRQWFLAVHLPVPLVIALRVFSGLGFQLASFPLIVVAFFLGQYVGGRLTQLSLKRRLTAGGVQRP
jgi:hypothetical protein